MAGERAVPLAPYRDAERGGTALVIIDMIGRMEFGAADRIREEIGRTAEAIARLRDEAAEAGLPVIFVNDNFGEWHSEASRLVARATEQDSPGRPIAERLRPTDADYFIIKPQFSGFYATNLPVLLPKLGVSRLILTGLAADICVLFTAADAHMRDYGLWVPEDAVVAADADRTRWALAIMEGSMKAETRATTALTIEAWQEIGEAEEKAGQKGSEKVGAESS